MTDDEPINRKDDAESPEVQWRQKWDTGHVRRQDRFSYFREGVCQTFLAYTPEKPSSGDLSARIEKVQLGSGWLGKIAVTPHAASRTNVDMAKASGEEYLSLGIQLSGMAQVQVAGNPFVQNAGSVFLVDPSRLRHVDMRGDETYATMAVLIEKSRLKGLAAPDLPGGHVTLTGQPMTEALVACLSMLARRSASATLEELGHLYDAAVSLLAASLVRDNDQVEASCHAAAPTRGGMLILIRSFVEQNLTDPDLSPRRVAMRFGLSVRYLHKLFDGEGETFGASVLALRLEQVRADLLDPAIAAPVSDIAHRWGFRDPTSFHRNFKRRYQETPGSMRLSVRRPGFPP